MVSLGKPIIHKLKILGGGKLEYYKPMRGGGGHNFDSNLVGGKILEEIMVYFWKNLHQEYVYKLYLNKTNTIYTIIIHKNE